jgi:hypothetical protein
MHIRTKKYIIFSAILAVLLIGAQFGIDQCYNRIAKNKINKLLEHKIDTDIAIFGSSVANSHFIPAIIDSVTGHESYNFGFHGLFCVQYNALIHEFLQYTKECKYMVIGCDIDNLDKNELITRPDLFYSHLHNPWVYHSLVQIEPAKIKRAAYLPGYKLTLLNKLFYNELFVSIKKSDFIDVQKGFAPGGPSWNTDKKADSFAARYNADIYNEFDATLQKVSDKGIKVILVLTPIYKQALDKITNIDFIRARYTALADNKSIFFIDYTKDSICNEKKLFTNYTHLNPDGAKVISQKISSDLNRLMNIEPTR